jgi:hypothetical protein
MTLGTVCPLLVMNLPDVGIVADENGQSVVGGHLITSYIR